MSSKLVNEQNESSSRPVLKRNVRLDSSHAQQAYRRNFDQFGKDSITLTVTGRIYAPDQVVSDYVESLRAGMIALQADLQLENERCKHLMNTHGIVDEVEYTSPWMVSAEITTPLAGLYLQLILGLDTAIKSIDTLWHTGVVNDKVRTDRTYELRQRVIKAGGKLRGYATLIRKYRNNKLNPDGADDEGSESLEEASVSDEVAVSDHGTDEKVVVLKSGPKAAKVARG